MLLRFVAVLTLLLVSACTLSTSAVPDADSAASIPTLTAPPAANTVIAPPTQPPPTATPARNNDSDCPDTPANWSAYTVRPGDTLSGIARRNNTTTSELTIANCLASPDQIVVGQVLYIPGPGLQVVEAGRAAATNAAPTAAAVTTSIFNSGAAANGTLQFYLVIPDDNGQTGTAFGCGDSIVGVDSSQITTGTTEADLQAALSALLAINTATYADTGYQTALYNANLSVESVAVSADTVRVDLTGTLRSVGACWDARVTGQLLFTIFQFSAINNALIRVDGRNLKQMFDASGAVSSAEPYRRADFAS